MRSDRTAIGAARFAKGADIDGLLADVTASLTRSGVRLGGVLQNSDNRNSRRATSVEVVDLYSGEHYDIWEPRGHWARGCRLDENGLAEAEARILQSLDAGIDMLILNRFGRAESKGRGLIGCFVQAMAQGVPILTAVREPFDVAWDEFHAGLGTILTPNLRAILRWAHHVLEEAPVAVPATAEAASL